MTTPKRVSLSFGTLMTTSLMILALLNPFTAFKPGHVNGSDNRFPRCSLLVLATVAGLEPQRIL